MQKSSKMETLEISSAVLTAQLAPKQQNNKILLCFIALWIYNFARHKAGTNKNLATSIHPSVHHSLLQYLICND